ncbi:hypothetical protein [Tumebacillus flagellatus]|uniref:Uncharacterized protein n=1 Tax=Tumebacillus flagellatus TaxID=1157490 RepID=A0A074LEX4_9BACL|nr:hypothetical protein [Tumebacillus flagellatus]KEO80796.1 hypothetical protein EL26_24410 [Tumebacillus flagellatus]
MVFWMRSKNKKKRKSETSQIPNQILEQNQKENLNARLEDTVAFIQNLIGDNDDFVIRRFQILGRYPAALL